MEYKMSMTLKRAVVYILMVFFALLAIVPIYLMLINATRTNAQINEGISLIPGTNTLQNWKNLTNRNFQIWQGFGNSAVIAFFSTIFSVYFSSLTAYAIHVYKFKGRKFLWAFILTVIMLPGTLSFIGFYQFMARLHLTNSFIPLIVPSIASAGSVLFMKQYMESILSFELIDAGRIDGAGEFRIFNTVIMPIMIPAVATQSIFAFVGSWNNFMTPFVLLSDQKKYTLPMLVQTLRGDIYRTEYGSIYLGVAISLLPILVFYAFMSRFIISGITMGGVKE
ncbi:MAG: carbohydrate ABC transporter permease [Treponemataceae bacterium]|nr:carbohydrate ABC transporter permease [Treponemataceae bacterium]